jgi:hypothetical protein
MIKHVLIASTAALGWLGLLIQFPLTLENSRAQGMTLIGGTIAYLSFFTILTNPYPFIDAGKLGYSSALGNAAVLVVAFAILSLVVVAIGRWTERHSPGKPNPA